MAIDLTGIKNIIFDLGVVLLNTDVDAPIREFKKLGVTDLENKQKLLNDSGIFEDIETAKITPQQFRDTFRDIIGLSISDNELDRIWNTVILDYPAENIELLEKLKPLYKTYILSNTNAIHCDYYTKKLREVYGYENLGALTVKDYYSQDLKLRKPGKEIFEVVMKLENLIPEDTLFIDDSKPNVLAARELGIRAHHLISREKTVDLFNDL